MQCIGTNTQLCSPWRSFAGSIGYRGFKGVSILVLQTCNQFCFSSIIGNLKAQIVRGKTVIREQLGGILDFQILNSGNSKKLLQFNGST